MTKQTKACRNCGTETASTKHRVCRSCGGRRFDLRDLTEDEIKARESKVDRMNALIEELAR